MLEAVAAALTITLSMPRQGSVSPQAPPPPLSVATGDSAFSQRRYGDALASFERALSQQPTHPGARVKAGYAALALGRLDIARKHFRVLVDAAPAAAPVAKAGLAMAAAREGKAEAALLMLDSAVAAGYGNHDALDQERAFDAVRSDPRFVQARSRAEAASFPCLSDSASRVFDFWVGEWDVYVSGTGQHAGVNIIEKVAGGCALLENWTATSSVIAGPVTSGKSLNFVDQATGLWKQVWMGSGRGQNDYVNGRYADRVMRFEFTRRNPKGATVTGRFAFHNLGPNRVRQVQESSTDGGKSFSTNYDFVYVRRGSGERP